MTKAKDRARARSGKCICGSNFEIPEGADPDVAGAYEASFWRSHSGKGHGRVDPHVDEGPAAVQPADQGGLF